MSETSLDLATTRFMQDSDVPFIYAQWLRGLYYGNPWFREIDQKVYFDKYHKIIETLLARDSVQVRIVCLKEDADVILAFIVTEDNGSILHWIFTRPVWRRIGIAKELVKSYLPDLNTKFTHLTIVGKDIKPKQWIFNPFLV